MTNKDGYDDRVLFMFLSCDTSRFLHAHSDRRGGAVHGTGRPAAAVAGRPKHHHRPGR